ncbi:MAG: Dihydrofolate synthase/folylpolyglutamate synthase [Cellulomonadaceae bacterium TMED98]|nr:MAG: Dihydrofolate synthase/folylpolyglutamate synthase [Cellulomonadaceae bacterium TMED98]
MIIDAAHNPHGAESLARALMQSFQFETLVVVLGVLRDKDARGIVEALDPLADMFVVTQSESDRAVPAEDLAEAVVPVAGPDRTSWRENVVEAIVLAQRQAGPDGGVVVTGSVTLIAEALEWAGR